MIAPTSRIVSGDHISQNAVSGPQSDRALSLLGTKMGTYGPDLLFELRANPKLKARVEAYAGELETDTDLDAGTE